MEQKMFSVEEVAKMLGWSYATTYRRVKQGYIKATTFGKRYMIPKAEIDRLEKGE
ncbi:MAG: DNA-binding protein [Erysipelotrichia bacterium]|nr:DNA-binding protein [Erysipelotrichia bacterium]